MHFLDDAVDIGLIPRQIAGGEEEVLAPRIFVCPLMLCLGYDTALNVLKSL
jgi:hypothetical protein